MASTVAMKNFEKKEKVSLGGAASLVRGAVWVGLSLVMACGGLAAVEPEGAGGVRPGEPEALDAADDRFVAPLVELPGVDVWDARVANTQPLSTFAMPVSILRYEPRVDIQERNTGEAQADVSIRGGTFESTAFRVGAVTLFDPQTGHYFAEIPIAPQMLSLPVVETGVANALSGFNSLVGTIQWNWAPIVTRAEVGSGIGNHGLNYQSMYGGWMSDKPEVAGRRVGMDIDIARSEGNGTIPGGDHEYMRYNGRIQLRGENDQLDLFGGYQSKFFGWPDLYAPQQLHNLVGSSGFESENLQTTLLLANYRTNMTGGDYLEVSGYFRRNRDDYDFDRYRPNLFGQPFMHETRVWSLGWDGRFSTVNGDWALRTSGQFLADSINSTALTFGNYRNRNYLYMTVAPEYTYELESGWTLTALAGVSLYGSNRDSYAGSPLARLAATSTDSAGREWTLYTEFAKSAQLPGYTALNSNPAGGLFRGDASLGMERAYNYEIGAAVEADGWLFQTSLFYRQERDLTDWVYDSTLPPTASRAASAVNVDTIGCEVLGGYRRDFVDLLVGYTYLSKSESYRRPGVDASFYSGNYPRHRVTAAAVVRLPYGFELRLDNEFRVQAPNTLRSGTSEPIFTTVGLFWFPSQVKGLELSASLDNVWDTRYEQVPGVPGGGRQWTLGATMRF